MFKKRDEALLRGFLNLYDINYNSDNVEYSNNEEFLVYKDFIHRAYPEFNFNILISSKDIVNLDNSIISKYNPFISISRVKPTVSSKNENPFFIKTTFYDPSFIELYSFKYGKSATWSNIDNDLLIKTDDIEDQYVLDKLIEEEKRKIRFQMDSKTNYGKIEQLINILYTPDLNIPGKLIKPYLESERTNLFSKLKSPVIRILKQLYYEGIGQDVNFTLTTSISNNLDENYTFGLNNFKYETLLDEDKHFFFSQSCKNLYNIFYNFRSLKISETSYGGVPNFIYIMTNHGRNSKKEMLKQYTDLFRYVGLIQDSHQDELFFVLSEPVEFINKLYAFFDIIKNGINQFKRDFDYLEPLLIDSLLSNSDLKKIDDLLQIFKEKASEIDPDLLNLDKNLRDFCFPLLIFSLFLGFCKEREYFIVPCEIVGEFQDKMTTLTTPTVQRGGFIKRSSSMEKNLEILYEMVKIDGSKSIRRRAFDINYIELISIKQKHDLLLQYGKYLIETLQRIKNTLNSSILEIESSEYSSTFVIINFKTFLKEIEDLKPKFASKNTLKPSLLRMNEIEESSEIQLEKWKAINIEYNELFNKITQFISQDIEIKGVEFIGCTDFNDEFENIRNDFISQKDELDQLKEKLRSIATFSLEMYDEKIKDVSNKFEKDFEKFEEISEGLKKYFEKENKELALMHALLKRASNLSDKKIRDTNLNSIDFLFIENKNCGDFRTSLNNKKKLINNEGDYVTNKCWNAYCDLLKNIEIEKLQDYGKEIQIRSSILELIDKDCLTELINLKIIRSEVITTYKT